MGALAQGTIKAGKECLPPVADGPNPCEEGHSCSGDKLEGGAEGSKSCKADHTCNGAKLADGAEGTLSCKKNPPKKTAALAQGTIKAGKECLPPVADGPNPCEEGYSCTGDKLEGGA